MESPDTDIILSEWFSQLSVAEKAEGKSNGHDKLLQWGKPVAVIKMDDFANEALFKQAVATTKNFPGCNHYHRAYGVDVFKCTHEPAAGVACPHMTKVVYKNRIAEIYENGKHVNSNLFEIRNLHPSQMPQALAPIVQMDTSSRMQFIDILLHMPNRPSTRTELLVAIARTYGLMSPEGSRILSTMNNQISTGSIDGMMLLRSMLKCCNRSMEPFTLPLLGRLLALHADKTALIRDLAASIALLLVEIICPWSCRLIFPVVLSALAEEDWRIRVGALNVLKAFAPRVSRQLSPLLPQLIPVVSECMIDTKRPVQLAAIDAMQAACAAITNEDIHHLVPQLVGVIARPDESPKTLDLLLETTFVTNVDAPTLALISPLLGKALRGRSSVLKRKAARVIDNMCRLVQEPADVAPFVPMLLPALDKVIDEIVDAEVCTVVKAAREILLKAMGEGAAANKAKAVASSSSSSSAAPASSTASAVMALPRPQLDLAVVHKNLLEALNRTVVPAGAVVAGLSEQICQHVAAMSAQLVVYGTDPNPSPEALAAYKCSASTQNMWRYSLAMPSSCEWRDVVVPYLSDLVKGPRVMSAAPICEESIGLELKASAEEGTSPVTEDQLSAGSDLLTEMMIEDAADIMSHSFRTAALNGIPCMNVNANADDANLCDIEFSLAFGGKILLHNANLRLGKGRRYGLMGKNGAGKTTLLTNIGNGNIEGLPTSLKTVYVQHDDASDDHGVSMIDEMMAGKDMVEAAVTVEDSRVALTSIGFSEDMLAAPRSALSGGWKMKLLIVRAMLSRANVLLLDEPTNHLDTASVAWLTNYLRTQVDLTCLIVSHDTVFLDNVVTDIIHYESRKLAYYHGNLTHFVEIHPEARYYYDLEGSTLSFKFPVPERLDGIASTTRSVLKMDNITYTYPGASKPTLNNVSVKLCLGSRVAVLGVNGAGKSTLIKLLVQEIQPDPETGGEIWKHHNLRVAYVAQHSFHHVEEHMDSSPVDYMKWRFAGGVDKEDLSRPALKMTEEEEQERLTERKYGDVEEILGRRKSGRTMEYECTFFGQTKRDPNKYIPVEKLIEMGLSKLVQQTDTRIAAMAAGLAVRPLLTAEIQGHLDDFYLESEFGTHGSIRRLSGGQKVKLVLAAAMWNRPHVLILDEPTNYLDRQALGALTQAIKSYGGGVLIISHNQEFTDALCTEKWIVKDGDCITKGEAEDTALKAQSANSIKKSRSTNSLEGKEVNAGNINKTIQTEELLNPKTLEKLSKKEVRKLEKCCAVAGVSIEEYVSKIKFGSPEWSWL